MIGEKFFEPLGDEGWISVLESADIEQIAIRFDAADDGDCGRSQALFNGPGAVV